MADDQGMTVRAAASKLLVEERVGVLGEAVRVMLGEVMEAEVPAAAGADWYERSRERMAQRNGYRPAGVGHAGGDGRAGHPAVADGVVLAELLGAAAAL